MAYTVRRMRTAIVIGVLFAALVGTQFLAPAAHASTGGFSYTVAPGDSLWKIGQRFGVTVQQLQQANGITGTLIYAGQSLWIPSGVYYRIDPTPANVDLLARLIRGEAESEPYVGQVAVGAVVLNRVASPLFPNTLAGVIYQPYQFEVVDNGRINLPPTQESINAAWDAIRGWDPTNGALFFFDPAKTTNAFLWSLPVHVVIGGHRFAG